MIFNLMLDSAETIIKKIHHHPFNQELAQGILSEDKFRFYLLQDSLYLEEFSKALALTAARLSKVEQVQQFIEFSLEALKAERELHKEYLGSVNHGTTTSSREQNPACFMYSNYLLKMASLASVEEAMSCLLPCFFIYNEVGKNMLANHYPNNPYYDWIALYSSEVFELSVKSVINITNDLAQEASKLTQEKMIAAFVRSTQLEWLFWDGAYSLETWVGL